MNLAHNIARYLIQRHRVSNRKTGDLRWLIQHYPGDLATFLDDLSFKDFRSFADNAGKILQLQKHENPPPVKSQTQAEAKQRRKRSKRKYDRCRGRYREGLIIKQFGSAPIFSLTTLRYVSPESPCLDILFKGRGVRMAGQWDSLENLFGEERHTFPKSLPYKREGRTKLYYLDAFIKCLVHFLGGRAGRKQWLPEGIRGKVVLGRMIERAHRFSPELAVKLLQKLRLYLQ